ncbi:MAG: 2,5-diamino-6-(ribosylamino)-4(3H)-pyrimidinone 5'-phosphate reductase [Hadesarchaea archaeon]|nr:2,5-diamino-6-(ribosylamino)-4(3H)-pyrimidinone 5'-phosphate reductase [Hadesarchaea archaeon]
MTRPYVILNAAMTLDGKIATKSGDSRISGREDLSRTHQLRGRVDAVMVGIGTVLADNPSLTVRHAEGKNPTRVIVDSSARIPLDAKVLDDSAPTIIATTSRAKKQKLEELREKGAKLVIAGNEKVDLRELLKYLYAHGVKVLLLEGGSTLNWGMLKEGLVDEIRVTVSPRIVGGEKAKTLVGGEGFKKISEGIKLEPVDVRKIGEDILLSYRVVETKND